MLRSATFQQKKFTQYQNLKSLGPSCTPISAASAAFTFRPVVVCREGFWVQYLIESCRVRRFCRSHVAHSFLILTKIYFSFNSVFFSSNIFLHPFCPLSFFCFWLVFLTLLLSTVLRYSCSSMHQYARPNVEYNSSA